MFTKLYLHTTDPEIEFSQLFQPNIFFPIIISVLFHTIIYTLFFNLTSYIFLKKPLSILTNKKLVTCLIIIMFFGFFARFYHVKDIYEAYGKDMEKTRNHLDKLYISWVFIS